MLPGRSRWLAAVGLVAVLLVSACGGGTTAFASTPPAEAQELLSEPPAGLVVLDVRTPQEFAEGHIADAANIDFYEPSFAIELDGLRDEERFRALFKTGDSP